MVLSSSQATVGKLQAVVEGDRCVMFSTTWCSWCRRAQEFVQEKTGHSCRKVELDQLPPDLAGSDAAEVLGALTGQRSIPNLFIAKKHINAKK